MRAFADLYRRLDSATSTRAKQSALVDVFAKAKNDPSRWASAAWIVYFLAGGKPRQTVPTRLLRRLAIEGSGLPEWLCEECYHTVGDLAETLSLLLPEGARGSDASLDIWMRERLLPLSALDDEEKFARLRQWADELPMEERLVFFKLITGELRVGVSRLQVIKALAQVAGVEESRMAQRMVGYAQARRTPGAADFEALIGEIKRAEGEALDAGRPYPFYLAQSWQGPAAEMRATLGAPRIGSSNGNSTAFAPSWSNVVWAGGCGRAAKSSFPTPTPIWSRLPARCRKAWRSMASSWSCRRLRRRTRTRWTAFSRSQACSNGSGVRWSATRPCASCPVAFIAYDLLECDGRDIRAEPQRERRTALEKLTALAFDAASARGQRCRFASARSSAPRPGRPSTGFASRPVRSAGRVSF